MDEKLTLSEKQAAKNYKMSKKEFDKTEAIEKKNIEQSKASAKAKERAQKAENELGLSDIVSGIVKGEFTLD